MSCPGVTSYGHGMTLTEVHVGNCCADRATEHPAVECAAEPESEWEAEAG
jgi:hypothetical protein